MKCPVMSYETSVGLECLYIEAQGYVPVLLENLCGVSFSGTCLALGVVLCFSVGMDAFD